MRRSFSVIFSLVCIFSISEVFAACSTLPAGAKGCRSNTDEVLIIPGVGCYVCNNKNCGSGDMVSVIGEAEIRNGKGTYVNHRFTCKTGEPWENDYWEASPIPKCTESKYLKLEGVANAVKVVINPDTGQASRNDNASYVIQSVKVCEGYVCDTGYTEVNGACVSSEEAANKSRCESTGGTWSGNSCSCSSSKNLKKSSSDGMSCECVSSDYESDGVNGCKKKQSVIEKEEQQRQRDEQNRRNQQLSKACTDSGGVWKSNKCQCDSAKNLKAANNVCVCLDDTIYVRNGDRCDLTDKEALKRKCEAEASKASGAYWDDANGKCECNNSQYVWNGTICAINEVLVQCLSIEGANWNKLTGQCYCIDSGTVLPPEKMIENACSNVVSTVPQNQQNQQGQQVSRNRILNAVKTIDDIESNLGLSVWKDSEGNFNTSRLLSDSIAGVVLGTAGGLITSSVVKKNQVESGFEDIQCTVGGQVVAGWGDEFRVGIQ